MYLYVHSRRETHLASRIPSSLIVACQTCQTFPYQECNQIPGFRLPPLSNPMSVW